MAMVANKFKGVRSAPCFCTRAAQFSRLHNDTNVLSLGADYVTVDEAKEFEAMIYDFLETFESQFDIPEWNHYVNLHQLLEKRIKQTEGE